jgi:hypothetical protein
MLPNRLAAYLAYFERLAHQPPNRWEGFFLPDDEQPGFALRLQLAWPCYALAAICRHPEADEGEQERCRAAMAALIARMLQRRVWAAWGLAADRRGTSPDPAYRGNAAYSGHLAMMIGAFEAAGGDARFDDDWLLLWSSDARFPYSHHSLVQTICDQMAASPFGGIECAPGRAGVACTAPALWGARLHDDRHGGEYAAVGGPWLDFVRRRLVLRGWRRRIFSAAYRTRSRLAEPWGYNAHDACALALLGPLAPDLARPLAPRLLRRARRDAHGAHLPSANIWRRRNLADGALATGYCFLVAVQEGDEALAAALLAHADARLAPEQLDDGRHYGGRAAPLLTALFALGEAGGLGRLLKMQPEARPALVGALLQ